MAYLTSVSNVKHDDVRQGLWLYDTSKPNGSFANTAKKTLVRIIEPEERFVIEQVAEQQSDGLLVALCQDRKTGRVSVREYFSGKNLFDLDKRKYTIVGKRKPIVLLNESGKKAAAYTLEGRLFDIKRNSDMDLTSLNYLEPPVEGPEGEYFFLGRSKKDSSFGIYNVRTGKRIRAPALGQRYVRSFPVYSNCGSMQTMDEYEEVLPTSLAFARGKFYCLGDVTILKGGFFHYRYAIGIVDTDGRRVRLFDVVPHIDAFHKSVDRLRAVGERVYAVYSKAFYNVTSKPGYYAHSNPAFSLPRNATSEIASEQNILKLKEQAKNLEERLKQKS